VTSTEPLPRSLIPLPGESLPGLILRLSHRLGQAPGHILWRTGLTNPDRNRRSIGLAPKRLLLMLDPSEQQRFAAITRLDPAIIDQLTLRHYFATDPAVAEGLVRPGSALRPRIAPPTWLLFGNPRYCPQCLAGDGSEIQRRHGGAWKLQWHLPIVFACLEHRVFLRHRCSGCLQHANGLDPKPRLITSPGISGFHPAQCRNRIGRGRHAPLCGHRLDSIEAPIVELTPELEQLQPELLALLEDTADPNRSLGRLMALRHLSAIVCATWPHSLRGDLPAAVTEELATDLRPAVNESDSTAAPRRWDSAPPSAPATAAALSIAMHLLKLPLDELRKELQALAQHAPSNLDPAWGRTWNLLSRGHSPIIEHEIKQVFLHQQPPLTRPTRPTRRPAADGPILAPQQRGYLPEHIPQHLPEEWFTILLEASAPDGLPRTLPLRRIAALQLVQITTGQSMAEAAHFLGVPDAWLTGHLRIAAPPSDLARALEALASHIERATDPVDYRQRRERFASWSLPHEDWQDLIRNLPGTKPTKRNSKTHRRMEACASAFAWSKLTGSEWRLAPIVVPPLSPETPTNAGYRPRLETMMTRFRLRWGLGLRFIVPRLDEYADGLVATEADSSGNSEGSSLPVQVRYAAEPAATDVMARAARP
jgi:hypothetical protein